jgi:hypothetical protein
MPLKNSIVTLAAGMAISLSGTLWAQTAAEDAVAAREAATAAQAYARTKMDEATAADDKFHANRTEANMVARDKAEADAAEAIKEAHTAADRATAAEETAKMSAEAENPATDSEAKTDSPR